MELPFALIIRFLLLFSIVLIKTNAETPISLIFEICKKTRNPSLCSQILKSNRKALKAYSPQELGEIAIKLSINSALATKEAIVMKGFLRLGDRALRERLKYCQMSYASAIYYLKSSSYYMKHGDFSTLAKYAAAALNEPIYCRESFAKRPPTEPTWLKDGNEKLECLCSVVLVISRCLSGKNLSVIEIGNMYED